MESLQTNATQKMSTDSISGNGQSREASPKLNTTALMEMIPIAAMIIIINLLVICLFFKRRNLRTTANYILLSLAVSDIITGAVNIPLFIVVMFSPVVTNVTTRFYLGFLVAALHSFTGVSTVYHIFLATTEKYLSIINPVTHRLVTRKTVSKALCLVWLVSALIAFIPFAWIGEKGDHSRNTYFLAHTIFRIVMVFLVPYIFMIYAFAAIFREIVHGVGQNRTRHKDRSRAKKKMHRERKCIILFATMAIIFAVCWLPWYVIALLLIILGHTEPLDDAAHAFVLIRYTTAVTNPLLYTFFRPDFRGAIKSLARQGVRWIRLTFEFLGKFQSSPPNELGLKTFSESRGVPRRPFHDHPNKDGDKAELLHVNA